MSTTTKLVTYEEWLKMPEVQDATEEVVNGEIRIMPAPKFEHALVVTALQDALGVQIDRKAVLLLVTQFGLIIRRAPLSSRVPDLAMFRRSNMVVVDGYIHSAPELAVEVLSPSNTRSEREEKLRDYESLGVPEIWVLSPEARTFEVILLKDGKLTTVALQREGLLRLTQFPEVTVDIATVLAGLMFRITAALLLLLLPAVCSDDVETQIKRFVNAYAAIEREAADPVEPDKAFYEGAIPGLLRRLDPHSVFFDPGQFDQLRKLETSTQKGFGSVVSILPGRIIVLQTLPGTPSAKSGMAPGDEILAINGYAIDRLDMEQMIGLLTQSRQQPARLVVRSPGNVRVHELVLTPEEMQSPSVERAFFLKPGVGYLRVSSFDEKTGKQIQEAIEKLGGASLKGLVLDLRNNPGGLLPAALQTSALFLQPGQKLLTVRGRKVEEQDQTVPKGSVPYTFPVAVLINSKSASASEIVSGALQDHDRAAIVGEPSFGKGLVESVFPLSNSTGIALTTALYYTPSGRSIQKPLKGADFALSATASNPNKQSEFRTDSGRTVKGGGGIQPDYVVYPDAPTRLRAVLDATASFTTFAIDYFKSHPDIPKDFEVTPAILGDFELFCSQHNIQPGVGDWSRERGFIENRLKTEIFNQAFGVEKGDEVEAQRDAQILKALEAIGVK